MLFDEFLMLDLSFVICMNPNRFVAAAPGDNLFVVDAVSILEFLKVFEGERIVPDQIQGAGHIGAK